MNDGWMDDGEGENEIKKKTQRNKGLTKFVSPVAEKQGHQGTSGSGARFRPKIS